MERFTLIALIGNVLFAIGMLLASISLRVDGATVFGNLVSMMITIPIALYALNCAIVGSCTTYAMLYSYLSLGIGVAVLLMGLVWLLLGPPLGPPVGTPILGWYGDRHGHRHGRDERHEHEQEPHRRHYYDDRK